MSILHLQYLGQGKTPDGKSVSLPAADILQGDGPFVQVAVSVIQPIAAQLASVGALIPPPVVGRGLIDTGASMTCIDDAEAQKLGLPPVDVITMASASHSSSQANVYPIAVEIAGLPISINVPRAAGAALAAQGLLLLIGRDLLRHCTLHYNGLSGEITLAI